MPDAVLDVVLAQTGGNPLALAELPTTLGPDQLSGATDLPGLLPLSARVEAAFLDRARDLDPDAAAVLLLVAADDTGDVAVVEKATTRSGLPAAAFEAAERTGLFTTAAGEIVLRHPLVRSAVYAGATATERRRAHRALAEVVTDPQRRAWHLAAAADGTDETAAAALVEAGERARARGGHSGAAAAFARAADLTPIPPSVVPGGRRPRWRRGSPGGRRPRPTSPTGPWPRSTTRSCTPRPWPPGPAPNGTPGRSTSDSAWCWRRRRASRTSTRPGPASSPCSAPGSRRWARTPASTPRPSCPVPPRTRRPATGASTRC
ncbi:hypothetical protein ACFQV8_39835 [Pseudonocardia benzenivorans]